MRGGRASGIGGWERGDRVGGWRGDDFTRVGQVTRTFMQAMIESTIYQRVGDSLFLR